MTQVIIDDVIPRTQLTATAGQTVFNTNWTADAASDIDVYARADGVEPDDATQLVSPSLYNVTFIGASQTVRVTFLSGRTLDDIITIVRNTPSTRMNLYINTNFVPSMLNQDFGILTLVDQQAQMYDTVVNPGYNVSATIDAKDKILPILSAYEAWRMNAAGTAIEPVIIPDGGFAPQIGSFVTVSDERADLPNSFPLFDLGNASTGGMGIPAGTTAERVNPTPPNIGLRFNTDLGIIEAYIGAVWVEIPSSAAGLFLPLAGGTMAGDILMNANFIKDLPVPVDPDDAATKDYVDTLIGEAAGGVNTNIQFNDNSAFGGDPNFVTDGAGNVDITGSLDVDNLNFNGNRISATTGLVELEDAKLFNDMDADSNKIINLATPTAGGDAANKTYVDSVAAGFFFVEPVRVASTANFTSTYNNGASGVGATLTATVNGAASIDGVSLSLNDRVLFKNQTSTLENGIYYVSQVGSGGTPAIYTRALDYDQPSDIDPGDMVTVLQGTANASTFWVETATVTTIGTDPITFTQFGVSVANVVTISGTQTITGDKTFSGDLIATDIRLSNAGILDNNGNTILALLASGGTPVNYFQIENNIATGSPVLSAIGGDTNIGMQIDSKGSSGVYIKGQTTGLTPPGYRGEVISAQLLNASAVAYSTTISRNITSISLTAGTWLVLGGVAFSGSGNVMTQVNGWSSTTSASIPDVSLRAGLAHPTAAIQYNVAIVPQIYTLSGTTTVYLSGNCVFGSGSVTGCGIIIGIRL